MCPLLLRLDTEVTVEPLHACLLFPTSPIILNCSEALCRQPLISACVKNLMMWKITVWEENIEGSL